MYLERNKTFLYPWWNISICALIILKCFLYRITLCLYCVKVPERWRQANCPVVFLIFKHQPDWLVCNILNYIYIPYHININVKVYCIFCSCAPFNMIVLFFSVYKTTWLYCFFQYIKLQYKHVKRERGVKNEWEQSRTC